MDKANKHKYYMTRYCELCRKCWTLLMVSQEAIVLYYLKKSVIMLKRKAEFWD